MFRYRHTFKNLQRSLFFLSSSEHSVVYIFIADKLSNLPRKYENSLVFLHPLTLKQLQLSLGEWAVLDHCNSVLVWPDASLPLENIGVCLPLIKELKVIPDEHAILYKCEKCPVAASNLEMYTE